MDQNKNQGQQDQGQGSQGNTPSRDPAEGARDDQRLPGDQHQGNRPGRGNQERGSSDFDRSDR